MCPRVSLRKKPKNDEVITSSQVKNIDQNVSRGVGSISFVSIWFDLPHFFGTRAKTRSKGALIAYPENETLFLKGAVKSGLIYLYLRFIHAM